MRALSALAAAAALSIGAAPAAACSCRAQPEDLDVAVRQACAEASAVVVATAESVEVTDIRDRDMERGIEGEITQFRVQRSWKGMQGERFATKIITACCLCGISFGRGESWLLYLHGPDEDGYYSTSICTRSRPLASAQKDIDVLDRMAAEDDPTTSSASDAAQ